MWDAGVGENQMKLIIQGILKQQRRIQTGPGGETYYGRVPGGVWFGLRAPDTTLAYNSPLDIEQHSAPIWYPGMLLGKVQETVSPGTPTLTDKIKNTALVIGLLSVLGIGLYAGHKIRGTKTQVIIQTQPPAKPPKIE